MKGSREHICLERLHRAKRETGSGGRNYVLIVPRLEGGASPASRV